MRDRLTRAFVVVPKKNGCRNFAYFLTELLSGVSRRTKVAFGIQLRVNEIDVLQLHYNNIRPSRQVSPSQHPWLKKHQLRDNPTIELNVSS